MAGIILEAADRGPHLDLLAMDLDRWGAIFKEASEGARGLEADQQDGGIGLEQVVLEMMADAAGLAHAARRDNDVEAREAGNGLTLIDAFGRLYIGRFQSMQQGLAIAQ